MLRVSEGKHLGFRGFAGFAGVAVGRSIGGDIVMTSS